MGLEIAVAWWDGYVGVAAVCRLSCPADVIFAVSRDRGECVFLRLSSSHPVLMDMLNMSTPVMY